jgi:hypothetical protein
LAVVVGLVLKGGGRPAHASPSSTAVNLAVSQDGPAWSSSIRTCTNAAWVIVGSYQGGEFSTVYLDDQGNLVNRAQYKGSDGQVHASQQIDVTGGGQDAGDAVYAALTVHTQDANGYLRVAVAQLISISQGNQSGLDQATSSCTQEVNQ